MLSGFELVQAIGLTIAVVDRKFNAGLIHPPSAPRLGKVNVSNYHRTPAIGERVGKAGTDFLRSSIEVFSCAIFATRKPWRIPCAMH